MLKKPLINTLVQVMGKAMTVMISLVITGILTRKLGPGVYGSYTLVTSVFILLDSLADFGTKIIGVREASVRDKGERNEIYVQVGWIRLLTTAVAFGLGMLVIQTWSGFAAIRLEATIALTMIWFTSLAGSLEIIFQTVMRMDLKVAIDVVFPLIFLVVLFIWNQPVTLLWVFLVYLAARILSLVFGFGLIKDFWDIKICKIDWNFFGKFLKEAWPMGVYLIIFAGYDRAIDSILIQKYVGIREVAFYGLAYKIYSNLIQPAYFYVNSIFPMMSSKMVEKRKLFKISTLLIISGIALVLPVIYFLAPTIINILAGNGFEASVVVLRILLVALIFSYISHLVGFTLIARGGQKELLVFGVISLIINVVGNLIAIPIYGIVGAAVVTGLTEASTCAMMSFRLWRCYR